MLRNPCLPDPFVSHWTHREWLLGEIRGFSALVPGAIPKEPLNDSRNTNGTRRPFQPANVRRPSKKLIPQRASKKTRLAKPRKPAKPYPTVPLFARISGNWAKKARRVVHYLDRHEDDPMGERVL
jgi:hypothetical protein